MIDKIKADIEEIEAHESELGDGEELNPAHKAEYLTLKQCLKWAEEWQKEAETHIPEKCNVMAITKVVEKDDYYQAFIGNHEDWKFPKENKCELYEKLNDEVILCHVNNEKWVRISKDYYNKARKISQLFLECGVEVYAKKKNSPVLIKSEDLIYFPSDMTLGFILAPRIEDEDREDN